MSVAYILTSLVVVLMPGTGVIYTLAVGIAGGLRAGVIAAFGCTLGIVPHILASIVGLAAVLHASATAFQIIKILGVIYLFYMAVRMLGERGGLAVPDGREAQPASARAIVANGVLLNILNPKLSLFFLAFLPQFVPADSVTPTVSMLVHSAVFMGLTFLVFAVYGAMAAAARDLVVSRPSIMAWLKRSFAAAFTLLGLRLAFAER
ncbi:LysE family translocator [Acuticoccus mangrovi]|uniref:LysE family translocator n=1 Tax=Acuticoccus mangrovi TaxID=2796142 RepID=A0A934MCS6_9HYPH|nr:LysE family translocator [Acuticoccus mangrovi]MBJ3775587.1 LysE family translocator [Acuticoccus mangrovi]